MRKIILATVCTVVMGLTAGAASAQTMSPSGQNTVQMNNPMNAQARMMKHSQRHMMKRHHAMKRHNMMKHGM
jgi:hypothetical protein